ncbi:acylphosphatase [Microdochium nivale]|nr:acylphosphatase [Microdochium nivale]
MSQRLSFLAHGRVQGVNYRNFTAKKATELGVTGWCRNTEAGKVEGEAQGSPEALKQFIKELDNGPTHAHVVQLDQNPLDVKEGESEFRVRR